MNDLTVKQYQKIVLRMEKGIANVINEASVELTGVAIITGVDVSIHTLSQGCPSAPVESCLTGVTSTLQLLPLVEE